MPILADVQLRSIQMISWHDFQISCWLILIRKILLLVSYLVLDILSMNIRVELWMLICLHASCVVGADLYKYEKNGFSSTQMGKGSKESFSVVLAPVSVYLLLLYRRLSVKISIVSLRHLVLPPPPASVYSKYNWLQLQMNTYRLKVHYIPN